MLLRTDIKERNAWHIPTFVGKLDEVKELWDIPKDSQTTEEIK